MPLRYIRSVRLWVDGRPTVGQTRGPMAAVLSVEQGNRKVLLLDRNHLFATAQNKNMG